MRSLRIGINALYMIPGGVGGTEIYLRSLLRALARTDSPHSFVVFINAETDDDLTPDSPQFQTVRTRVCAVNRPWRVGWEQLGLPGQLRRHKIDVLLNPGFTGPMLSPCPSVTVFHDLQHKRHPEYFHWYHLPFWRFFLYASAHRSARIIAVSEPTRRDFIAHYHRDPAHVHVIHHGVDTEFFNLAEITPRPSGGAGSFERYILTVSTSHQHKNFRRLLLAYGDFAKKRPDINMVIGGLRGSDAASIEQIIAELNLREKVRCTGWIPREELHQLFAGADAFIFPTTFEGFGMTLLEAMAAGLPVACSNIEPLRTLAGKAALFFDPHDTQQIEAALFRITCDENLRDDLRKAGPCQARKFSWDETASLTMAVLLDAAGHATISGELYDATSAPAQK